MESGPFQVFLEVVVNTDFHVWKGYSTDRWTVYIAGTIGADGSFDSALHGVSGKIMLNLRGITGIIPPAFGSGLAPLGSLARATLSSMPTCPFR